MSAGPAAKPSATVVGQAVYLPDDADAEALPTPIRPGVHVGPPARDLLGRRGLRDKTEATVLALCAVELALRDIATLDVGGQGGTTPARTGVVVSCNLGGIPPVVSIAETVRAQGVGAVSALDVPNASGNVVSAAMAIRGGFSGPNLTVSVGRSGGLAAVRVARSMLRTARADRMIVVGVEPGDPVGRRLVPPGRAVGAVAACLLLERDDGEAGAPVRLGRQWRHDPCGAARHPLDLLDPIDPAVGPARWLRLTCRPEPGGHDLSGALGDIHGAMGVVQAALAAAWLRRHPDAAGAVTTCGDAHGYLTQELLGHDRLRDAAPGAAPGRREEGNT